MPRLSISPLASLGPLARLAPRVSLASFAAVAGLCAAAGCGDNRATPADAAPDLPDAASDAPPDAAVSPIVRLADSVTDAPGATGTGFGDPTHATNGVRGAGTASGSFDVYSIGYTPQNDHLTLAWSHGRLANGPGADLAVFENPFVAGTGNFMDPIIVEVSLDGVDYRALAHDYVAPDPTVYSTNPDHWQGFAGRTPVLLNVDTNPVDPFNPALAGGDAFDLDTVVGDDAVSLAIRATGARFVRLVAAPARLDPHTSAPYVHAAISNGPDIDGLYGRYVVPE